MHDLRLEGEYSANTTLAVAGVGAKAVSSLIWAVCMCIAVVVTTADECTDLILFTCGAGVAGRYNASISDLILIHLFDGNIFQIKHIKEVFLRLNSV